jgi:hypothetical protein
MVRRKTKTTAVVPTQKNPTGINVAIPNTTEEKMRAICDVASAVRDVARALVSVSTTVHIEGNTVYCAPGGPPGIKIENA